MREKIWPVELKVALLNSFQYDKDTGLILRTSRSKTKVGTPTMYGLKIGQSVNGKMYFVMAQRLAYFLATGESDVAVRMKDGDYFNLKFKNLVAFPLNHNREAVPTLLGKVTRLQNGPVPNESIQNMKELIKMQEFALHWKHQAEKLPDELKDLREGDIQFTSEILECKTLSEANKVREKYKHLKDRWEHRWRVYFDIQTPKEVEEALQVAKPLEYDSILPVGSPNPPVPSVEWTPPDYHELARLDKQISNSSRDSSRESSGDLEDVNTNPDWCRYGDPQDLGEIR